MTQSAELESQAALPESLWIEQCLNDLNRYVFDHNFDFENSFNFEQILVKRISFYDHSLSHEECLNTFMFFGGINNPEQLEQYLEFENKMIAFYEHLLSKNRVFLAFEGKNKIGMKRIRDKAKLQKIVRQGLRRERRDFQFLIPKFRTLIMPGFDLTWQVFLYEPDDLTILKMAQEQGIPVW